MSKRNNELTEEKLQSQIQADKQVYQDIHWKLMEVEYRRYRECINFIFELKKECPKYHVPGQKPYTEFSIDVSKFKCLKGKTDDEIEKVSLLGERAIQWEDLDIQIGLDDLLMSVQLRENWIEILK